MPARSTMTTLITRVRELTAAGTAEYTVAGATYWSDEQIQTVLDRHREDVIGEPLEAIPRYTGSTTEWREHRSRYEHWEQTDAGTATFVVEDGSGNDAGTALWTADYERGIVTFGTDTSGTRYYLTGRRYDLYGAAAELLTMWATKEKLSFDFEADGQRFARSQKVKMLTQMADEYRMHAWPRRATMERTDVVG